VSARELPILFQSPLVLKIIDGTKTRTRRLLRGDKLPWKRGDLLWVRETHAIAHRHCWAAPKMLSPHNSDDACYFAAGWDRTAPRWRPSIHMPRWAARLFLEVENTWVEPLQNVTEFEAELEGAPAIEEPDYSSRESRDALRMHKSFRAGFRRLWNEINGDRQGARWSDNPLVAVCAFRLVDHVGAA
jgi:hypothetical protein